MNEKRNRVGPNARRHEPGSLAASDVWIVTCECGGQYELRAENWAAAKKKLRGRHKKNRWAIREGRGWCCPVCVKEVDANSMRGKVK